MHGQGVLKQQESKRTWTGKFYMNKMHGEINQSDHSLSVYKYGMQLMNSGDWYRGQMKCQARHGLGMIESGTLA